ncbi:MAG TPA: condensation domain-containing protein [Pseudonocardiaceae bacterium]|nr:condensation domain-containing protein [Pseudonocardiaceae bacterium]
MSSTEKVLFHGERNATDVLTWGQRAIWTAIERTRPSDAYFNFARVIDLREDGLSAGLHTVLTAVGQVVSRHEALRTRMSVVDGGPIQLVSAMGELAVQVVEGTDETAARRADEFTTTAFDYEREWPLRVAVVTTDGVPTHVVLGFCHLAADFGGSVFVLRDLRSAIAGTGVDQTPVLQPLDLAEYQRSAAGLKAARAAADYWARTYQRIPTSMYEHATGAPEQPRYQRAFLLSPALAQASVVLGNRLGTGSAAVLNAAFAVVMRGQTGHDICAMLAITKNRFREQTRSMVSTLALEGLLVVPLDEAADFDDVVRTAWRAAVPAYRYAQYDERDRDRIVDEVSEQRGAHVHPYACLNDLREDDPETDQSIPFAGTPTSELLSRTVLDWLPPLENVSCRFCLHVGNAPEGLAIRLTADTNYLRKSDMTDFLASVESLVVAGAEGPVPLPAAR